MILSICLYRYSFLESNLDIIYCPQGCVDCGERGSIEERRL